MGLPALMLPVGGERYALELSAVREVVQEPALVRVPSAAAHVRGLFNLRGRIVAALDTGTLLGLSRSTPPAWWAVAVAGEELCAFGADAAPRRVVLEDAVGPGRRPGVRSRHLLDGEAIGLIDIGQALGENPPRP